MDVDPLLLAADKPKLDLLLRRFSGMKEAALEILSQICDLFFFSFKVHQVGGTMGAAI